MNMFQNNDDIQYYFKEGLDWDSLIKLTENDFADPEGHTSTKEAMDFYREILTLVADFTEDSIRPKAKILDEVGMKFKDGEVIAPKEHKEIFDAIAEMELHGMSIPRELGGMNTPFLMTMAAYEIMGRADTSILSHFGFHGGMAMAMFFYAVEEGKAEFDGNKLIKTKYDYAIKEIISGKAWGSMDITEPHAGSDMANLTTKAVLQDDGTWKISGQKIWITSGHAKYHFVVARTDGDNFKGLDGLSLFLVEAYNIDDTGKKTWNLEISGIEKKIGLHASATCTVHYDQTPGILIGKVGEGFRLMLKIMNNARIGVGFESLSISEEAYHLAHEFANERVSMGKKIAQHEMIADYLKKMEVETKAIRALCYHGCYYEEMAQKMLAKAKRLNDSNFEKKAKEYKAISRRITPLLKYYASEKCVEHARMAIQIHGGLGYTKESSCEKLLRDALVFPIYEGTSQIQSLMAMKDTLFGVMKDPMPFVKDMAKYKALSLSELDIDLRRYYKVCWYAHKAVVLIITRLAKNKLGELTDVHPRNWKKMLTKDWDIKKDFSCALLHAERLTKLLIEKEISTIFKEQAEKSPKRKEIFKEFVKHAHVRSEYVYNEMSTYHPETEASQKVASYRNKILSVFS